jgi:hypothetical protein
MHESDRQLQRIIAALGDCLLRKNTEFNYDRFARLKYTMYRQSILPDFQLYEMNAITRRTLHDRTIEINQLCLAFLQKLRRLLEEKRNVQITDSQWDLILRRCLRFPPLSALA